MPANQVKRLRVDGENLQELIARVRLGNGYVFLNSDEIPSIVPRGLAAKWSSAVLVVWGDTNGGIAIVGYRVDGPDLDRDPFVVPIVNGVVQGGGTLVHHASFIERTTLDYLNAPRSPNAADLSSTTLSSGSTGNLPAPLFQAIQLGLSVHFSATAPSA